MRLPPPSQLIKLVPSKVKPKGSLSGDAKLERIVLSGTW
jgi:hypothetical protein